MLIRSINTLALVIAFSSASANEVQSRFVLGVNGDPEIHALSGPIVWRPVSDQLTRFTLTLPTFGIGEAIKYQDTTSLYYLSDVEDKGLSLVKDVNGAFDFYLKPGLSVYQYRHPITPSISLSPGTKLYEDEHIPILTGEYRLVTGDLSLQRNYLEVSSSFVSLTIDRTELSPSDNLEQIWSASFGSNLTRMSYGLRWFDVIGNENVLAEIGFIDEDLLLVAKLSVPTFQQQVLGLLANAASSETEALGTKILS